MRRAVLLASLLWPLAAPARQHDTELAGHYYLQGVHEVGSELLLRENHRFEWMLAYGALDQAAQGRWERVGNRVVLITDPRDVSAPLLRYAGSHAWGDEDERQLFEHETQAARQAALARCPFLDEGAYASTALPVDDSVPRGQRLHEAERAATTLEQAAREFERRADAAAKSGASPAAVEAARTARDAFESAWIELQGARTLAGLPDLEKPEPRLPAQCAMPPPLAEPPAVHGAPGVAVHIRDPELGVAPGEIAVRLEFDKGAPVDLITDCGWAGTRETRTARAVTVQWPARDGEPARRQRFTLRPAAVHEIALDARVLLPQPFERMELRIEGDALVPGEPFDTGRYTRD